MLCAGDELGHTQQGNNNPYCQDNETTWIDWKTQDQQLINFTSYVISLRTRLQPLGSEWGSSKITWFAQTGQTMADVDWHRSDVYTLSLTVAQHNKPTLMLLFNPMHTDEIFQLPEGIWLPVLNSNLATGKPEVTALSEQVLSVTPNTVMMLTKSSAPA